MPPRRGTRRSALRPDSQEQLEEEEEQEVQVPPTAAQEEAAQQEDSDDDAPEEVTLASSKAAAQAQVEQEHAATPKQRKRTRKQEQPGKQQQQQQEVGAEDQGDDGDHGDAGDGYALKGGADADADVLPDDVLEQLEEMPADLLGLTAVQQQRLDAHRKQQQKQQQLLLGAGPRKKRKLEQARKGPVVVTVLGAVSKTAPDTKSTFLKEHLYGSRIKRSGDTLMPANKGRVLSTARYGPAAKFA